MLAVVLIVTAISLTLSPIKVAFSVALLSLMAASSAYSASSSIFPSASVVISFSSGMMILFCYCAMAAPHESISKNNSMMAILCTMLPLVTLMQETDTSNSNEKTSMILTSTQFTVTAMCMVLLTMTSINKSMFSPAKSLISSYYLVKNAPTIQ